MYTSIPKLSMRNNFLPKYRALIKSLSKIKLKLIIDL